MQRWVLGILIWTATTIESMAGAWTLPEGRVQIIMTTARKIAPAGGFFGEPIDADSNSSQIFIEYGLLDDLTVGMTVFGEFSTTDDDVEASLGVHARHLVWQGEDGDVVSVQGGIKVPVERWLGEGLGDNRPGSVTELHLRLLYGRGWQTDWGNSFVSTELGLHLRGEGLDEELRFDVTAGHEPIKGLLGLFSVFSTYPLGGNADVSLKLSPSVAYTFWPWLGANDKKPYGPINPNTIQLGITWDAANPEDGLTASMSIWKGF